MFGKLFGKPFGLLGFGIISDLAVYGTIFGALFLALKVLEAISLWIREPAIPGL